MWQFSNRDILWCAVVIAAFAAWFSVRRENERIGRWADELQLENQRLRAKLDEIAKAVHRNRHSESPGRGLEHLTEFPDGVSK